MKKILSLIIIVFFSTFSLIIKANSAQKEFYGTASTGVVELISSPIIVKNEELTFDIYKSDLNYGNVATKVSAKYTFYNPSEYEVTSRLLFPYGNILDYPNFNKQEEYQILKNDEIINATIRHTYQEDISEFNIQNELKLINDEYIEINGLSEKTKIYRYVFKIESSEKLDNGYISCSYFLDNTNIKRIVCPQISYERTKNEKNEYRIYTSKEYIQLYLIGDDDLNIIDNFEFYNKSGDIVEGSLKLQEKEELKLDYLIYMYYQNVDNISKMDWHNACLEKLNNLEETFIRNIDFFNIQNQLLSWYDYTLTFMPYEELTNTVISPIIPYVNYRTNPETYKFVYLLTPASTWNDFSNLTININTDLYILTNSIEGFEKTDTGYSIHLEKLPQNELIFEMAETEVVEKLKNNGLRNLILIILGLSSLAWFFSLTIKYLISGIIVIILTGIILIIIKIVKNKKKKKENSV